MARTFDGPLSGKDIAWLKARYSTAYVERQIELLGTKKGAEDKAEDAAAKQAAADAKAAEQAEAERLQAEQAAAEAEAERIQKEREELGLDDDSFDVLKATESEVKTWAESASDEDKATALATEQAREDRDPRKGVVSLLS